MDTSRVLVFSHEDTFLFELSPREQIERTRRESINGEHSLTITCFRELEKEQRLLTVDGMGKWREYVVMGLRSSHRTSEGMTYTYRCVWSLQHDLSGVKVNKMVGTQAPCTAAQALTQLLSETKRWSVGTVTQATTGGTSMYYVNGWKAMQLLVDTWGGEVDADIAVDGRGVTSRSVSLYSMQGNQTATRRFDWAHDLTEIDRDVDESMVYCRVIPRGKGESVGDGYGRKITIESVNGGVEWLQDAEAAQLYRMRGDESTWEYPTAIIENGSIEEPQALKDWALSVMEEYTRPKVTYNATVSQYAAAGMDVRGVALGDAVQCVDRGFSEQGLRISGRVVEMVVNELDPADVRLTIGHITTGITSRLSQLIRNGSVGETLRAITGGSMTSAGFLSSLIDRLNGEINSTGGYWYMVEGLGTRTYDRAVSDPAVGAEATKVVEIRGGAIRIADSKTASGDWNWRTVFVSGHIAAELVTTVNIIAGFIGNASSGSYWDIDNGTLYISNGKTMQSALDDASKVATNYLNFAAGTGLDVGYSGTSAKTRVNGSGVEIFDGNGVSEAAFSGTMARIGRSDKSHIELTPSSGMELFDSSGNSAMFAGISSNVAVFRAGLQTAGNVVMSGDGYVDIRKGSSVVAHFGYVDSTPYFTLGSRYATSTYSIGKHSMTIGQTNAASGQGSFAQGVQAKALGNYAFALGEGAEASGLKSFAFNGSATAEQALSFLGIATKLRSTAIRGHAYGQDSVAIGYNSSASEICATAIGYGAKAGSVDQVAIGQNATLADGVSIGFGIGQTSTSSGGGVTGMVLYKTSGSLWVKGTVTQNSDKRLKKHIAYLGEDAAEFVRNLKPALFVKDEGRHLGFYAQDVQEADAWNTETVGTIHMSDDMDFDPLTLDYNALIAPLVAYTQHLERRIGEQEKVISSLVERLEKLEGTIR